MFLVVHVSPSPIEPSSTRIILKRALKGDARGVLQRCSTPRHAHLTPRLNKPKHVWQFSALPFSIDNTLKSLQLADNDALNALACRPSQRRILCDPWQCQPFSHEEERNEIGFCRAQRPFIALESVAVNQAIRLAIGQVVSIRPDGHDAAAEWRQQCCNAFQFKPREQFQPYSPNRPCGTPGCDN